MAEGEREGPDAHAALALVAAFAKAAREELLGFAPRPPAALPADTAPEVQPRPGSGVAGAQYRSLFVPEVHVQLGMRLAYSLWMGMRVPAGRLGTQGARDPARGHAAQGPVPSCISSYNIA